MRFDIEQFLSGFSNLKDKKKEEVEKFNLWARLFSLVYEEILDLTLKRSGEIKGFLNGEYKYIQRKASLHNKVKDKYKYKSTSDFIISKNNRIFVVEAKCELAWGNGEFLVLKERKDIYHHIKDNKGSLSRLIKSKKENQNLYTHVNDEFKEITGYCLLWPRVGDNYELKKLKVEFQFEDVFSLERILKDNKNYLSGIIEKSSKISALKEFANLF